MGRRTIRNSGGYQTVFQTEYVNIPSAIETENSGGDTIMGAELWVRYSSSHDWTLQLKDAQFNGLEQAGTPPLIGLMPESATNPNDTTITIIPPALLVDATGVRLQLLSAGTTDVNFGGGGSSPGGGGPTDPVDDCDGDIQLTGGLDIVIYRLAVVGDGGEYFTDFGRLSLLNGVIQDSTREVDGNSSIAALNWNVDASNILRLQVDPLPPTTSITPRVCMSTIGVSDTDLQGQVAVVVYKATAFDTDSGEWMTDFGRISIRNFTLIDWTREVDGNSQIADLSWSIDNVAQTIDLTISPGIGITNLNSDYELQVNSL